MFAPRSRAFSPSSRTSTAAPSPMTKPSRRTSNGRLIPLSDSASSALKAARASGTRPASLPPVTTASAAPDWISLADSPIACDPAAQADSVANEGPCSLWRIDTAPAPALPIMSGIESGDTLPGPCSSSTWWLCVSVPIPPMPVPMIDPMRAGS
jgi:hypothetical protein